MQASRQQWAEPELDEWVSVQMHANEDKYLLVFSFRQFDDSDGDTNYNLLFKCEINGLKLSLGPDPGTVSRVRVRVRVRTFSSSQ